MKLTDNFGAGPTRLLMCPNCNKKVVPEGADRCPECGFDGTREDLQRRGGGSYELSERAARERQQLEDTIAKGVERGVLRAVGIYLLVTVVIGIILAVIASVSRNS